MKKIKKENLEQGESYLVFTGYEWSPSGYDIAEYTSFNKELTSQSNGSDIMKYAEIIYELPTN